MRTSPLYSVIIPTLNERAHLGKTLEELAAGTPSGVYEVIVVDGGSQDDTLDLARSYGAHTWIAARGRARQMNAGAKLARGQYLYFLHADTLPPRDWLTCLEKEARLPKSFRLRFDDQDSSPALRLFAYLSRFDIDAFRYGDQSLCVSRQDFERIGGFDEGLQLFEDYDIVKRLKKLHGAFRVLDREVVTSARKYRQNGIWRTQAVFCLLYLAYRLGIGQQTLVRSYRLVFQ